jgi:hypothetical protein
MYIINVIADDETKIGLYEIYFFQNTERMYHSIIMHIFNEQKQKQSIIKLNKQSIHLT